MGIKPVAAGGLCADAVGVGVAQQLEAVAGVAVVGKTIFLCEGRSVVVINPAGRDVAGIGCVAKEAAYAVLGVEFGGGLADELAVFVEFGGTDGDVLMIADDDELAIGIGIECEHGMIYSELTKTSTALPRLAVLSVPSAARRLVLIFVNSLLKAT